MSQSTIKFYVLETSLTDGPCSLPPSGDSIMLNTQIYTKKSTKFYTFLYDSQLSSNTFRTNVDLSLTFEILSPHCRIRFKSLDRYVNTSHFTKERHNDLLNMKPLH